MVKGAREGDLPWDPIWAYVLGDEEEEDRKSRSIRFRKKRDVEPDDSSAGIMSFILPAAYDVTPDDSYASDLSVDEDAESRDHSEKSAVDLVAGLFSWDRREDVEKKEQKKWIPKILPRAQSELSEKSGDSAKLSQKSDDSKGLRSFLARSKSDSELASRGPADNNRALKLTSTAGKWLGPSAIQSSSDGAGAMDKPWSLGVTDGIFGLSAEDESEQKKVTRKRRPFLGSDKSVKENGSVAPNKSEGGYEDRIVRIRGLASAHSRVDNDQFSWDVLGLVNSNDTPQSFTGPQQRNHKSAALTEKPRGYWISADTESDIHRKKGLRGMMMGIPKAAKGSTNVDTDTSKKSDRRGLRIVKSKRHQSEANDTQRAGSQTDVALSRKMGRGPSTKKESDFKDKQQSEEVSTSGDIKDGRTTSLTGKTKAAKVKTTVASAETTDTLSKKGGKTKIQASDSKIISSKPSGQSVQSREPGAIHFEDNRRKAKNLNATDEAESESMQQTARSWLFGEKSPEDESSRERHGFTFGRSKNGRKGKKDEIEPEEGVGLSWLFGATSAEKEPKKERRIIAFGRSSSKLSKRSGPLNSRANCDDGKTKEVIQGSGAKHSDGRLSWLIRKSDKRSQGHHPGKSVDEKQQPWFSGGTKESDDLQASSDSWIWTVDSALWPTSDKAANSNTIEESADGKTKRRVHFVNTATNELDEKPEDKAFGWQGARSLLTGLQDWAWMSSSSDTFEDESPPSDQDTFSGTDIDDSSEQATSYSDTTEENVSAQWNEELTRPEIGPPSHGYNEVRLIFRPIADDEDTEDGERTDVRPLMTDRISMVSTTDKVHDFDYHIMLEETNQTQSSQTNAAVNQGDTWTAQFDEFSSDLVVEPNECIDSSLDGNDAARPSRAQLNWKMCRSEEDLKSEGPKWSEHSVHELSPHAMATLFPKMKAVSNHQGSCSVDDKGACALGDYSARIKADPNFAGTQSISEYEYDTGVHMFVSYDKFGFPSAKVPLQVRIAPVPRIYGDAAVIQVEASTVSLTDCYIRQRQRWGKDDVPLPNTPGVDFVGKLYRIDAATSKRHGLSVGDRVISLVKWGGNSRFISVDPTSLVKAPETIDPASAVCLAETYLTAFQVLHHGQRGKLRYRMSSLINKSILIIGTAVTNIGRAICQIASDGGATRIYALAKQEHYQELMAIGVSPLTGDAESWRPSLVGDVDCIVCLEENIDPAFYPLLKPNGQAVLVRFKDFVEETSIPTIDTFSETKGIWKKQLQSNIVVYNLFEEWEINKDLCVKDLQHLVDLLVETRIVPNVLDRVPLSKVARAQELVASARLSGFIVCEPWLIGKSICL